jgi:hypothetical protein
VRRARLSLVVVGLAAALVLVGLAVWDRSRAWWVAHQPCTWNPERNECLGKCPEGAPVCVLDTTEDQAGGDPLRGHCRCFVPKDGGAR